ncbi:MAG: TauD/TfdA family dioxygenase [Gammaproteobacteria bacterium]|nr:TauD/TfdA family dioxygenase [Gammaproteobacteria bacterium]MCW8840460.1 TauD/TfdA family dioxygenase [Gammaproteobacteria bacterium]MCW8927266.1 TauD/TfdA family dioxygenase [Gammaproteobacteria bacterium]MCW8957831.1 TauD/TfdA family dioxygenase [Gammaproteobacteria bacterium]MCW8973278.1 TauD/TfdA family dioxygenase [Gammaproteobacteria bacterium]
MLEDSPFLPDNETAYQRWRDQKLAGYPAATAALVVDLAAPPALGEHEYQALLERLRKTNMAIYRTPPDGNPDKAIPRAIAERFGLVHLDSNLLADDDGLTSITVNPEGDHPHYIPYTNRPINWHCDGYYNTGEQQIRGMLLHCVQPAAEGGENRLLDPEIVYLLLRDENPDHIHALMQPDVMTIPPGKDGEGDERPASVGPVFSIHEVTGSLHMRYTARKRNVVWRDDAATRAALAALTRILDGENHPYIFRARLEAGMGLICNNVLHTRDGFIDRPDTPPRLLYRARYFDRIRGT